MFSQFLLYPVIIISTIYCVSGARILAVFPFPSHSHQVVFRAITTELSRRGHEITTFTTDPANDPTLSNYTEVDLGFLYDGYLKKVDFFAVKELGIWSFLNDIYSYCAVISDATLSHPKMKEVLSNKTEKFDLMMVPGAYLDALYFIAYKLKIPMIGVSSLPSLAINHHVFGNPLATAYAPDPFLGYTDEMNLWQRMKNSYYYLRQIFEYHYFCVASQEQVLKKHFGDNVPSVMELKSLMSMVFINSHPYLEYPRPLVPGILYIGGLRFDHHKKPLPKDLEKILDESKEGFIYFSLGSNMKSNLLPEPIRNGLLKTFGELPYTVIWKFESDKLANKPDNVVIRKWLPQREVLCEYKVFRSMERSKRNWNWSMLFFQNQAHPNIKLFIYQGGLQSTEEAIESGIPVIGYPIFSDQVFNLNRLKVYGMAQSLDITLFDGTELKETIFELVNNKSYKENAVKLRALLRDRPYHPMEQAMWWINHVIRHKGAPHLRTKSRDIPWWKTELVDILLILFLVLGLITYFIFLSSRLILRSLRYFTNLSSNSKVRTLKKDD